jgi:hypothetical protein
MDIYENGDEKSPETDGSFQGSKKEMARLMGHTFASVNDDQKAPSSYLLPRHFPYRLPLSNLSRIKYFDKFLFE